MLNRRILRVKAFKIIYGYAVTGELSQKDAKKMFEASCEATRDLYLLMMAVIQPLTAEAKSRIEAARGKFAPTEEELHPNETFVNNLLAPILAEDVDFQKLLERKKLSWERFDIFIRDLFDAVSASDYYADYLRKGENTLAGDCRLFKTIFEREFEDNAALEAILEELSILWTDDIGYALTWCCRTMDDIASGKPWRLPELYQSDIILKKNPGATMTSDKDFALKLLSCALAGYEKYFEKVVTMVPDWDKDRLFSSDMALIACAMAEIDNFPDIPVRVSINEYVEISKFYCSPKSAGFVNGLLDKLARESGRTI